MQCPFCRETDDRVVNSRTNVDGTSVKRRRECNRCGRRYTTYERVEPLPLRVIKKDGAREEFSRKKVLDGLLKACYKRPVSTEALNNIVNEVELQLLKDWEREVPSHAIGELVMQKLRDTDKVAYIRFASVYRQFKDVTDFVAEAGSVLRDDSAARPPGTVRGQ